MADPLKLRIRDALVTALEGITIAAGYHTNAGTNVHEQAQPISAVTKFPYLAVSIGQEVKTDGCVTKYRSEQEYIVTMYVKSSDPDGDLLKLDADVKKALLATPQWGGLAVETQFREQTPNFAALTASGLGDSDASFVVLYDWSPTAP